MRVFDSLKRAATRPDALLNAPVFVGLGVVTVVAAGHTKILAFAMLGVGAALSGVVAWRRPIPTLVVVVVLFPFQQLVQAWLYKRGVSASTVVALGYAKEWALVVIACRAWRSRPRPLGSTERLALALLLLVAVFVLLPIGPPLRVRYVSGRAEVAFLIVMLSAWWLPATARQRDRAERAILVTAVVLALFGVWNYFGPQGWTNWADGVGLVNFRVNVLKAATFQPVERVAFGGRTVIRAGGIFLSSVTLAYMLLVAVAIAAGRVIRGVDTRLAAVAGAVCGFGIILTFTRSAMALLLLVGVVAAAASRRLSRGVGGAVVACLVLTALASFGNAGGQLRSGVNPNDPRTSAHITALSRSAGRVLTRPLGSGLGSAAAVAIRFNVKSRFENTEDFYLRFGTEVGLIGTILFIAFVVSLSRLVWRRSALDTRGPMVGAAAGIAAIAVGGMVLDTFGEMPATWALFLIIGMALRSTDALTEPDTAPLARAESLV